MTTDELLREIKNILHDIVLLAAMGTFIVITVIVALKLAKILGVI